MSRCWYPAVLSTLVYVVVLVATIRSAQLPADLGLHADATRGAPVVRWVMPASIAWDSGVRPGDLLVAEASTLGDQVVKVATSQHGLVVLAPERWRIRGTTRVATILVGGLVLLVAVTAVVRTRATPEACAISVPFFVTGIGLSVIPATSAMRGWALALTFGCVLALGPAFLSACHVLIRPMERSGPWWRGYRSVVDALAAGAVASYVAALVTGGRIYAAARWLEDGCLVASVLGGTFLVVWQLSRHGVAPCRIGHLVLLLGMGAGLVILAMLIVGPHLLGVTMTSPRLPTIGLLLLPAAYVYAVQRHHLLGMPSVWSRQLTHAIGATALAAIYFVLLSAPLPHWLGSESRELLPLTLAAFALGLSVLPFARTAARATDRLLFRDEYSHQRAVRQLVSTVGDASDMHTATARALGDVQKWLGLTWLAVLTRQEATWVVLSVATELPADAASQAACVACAATGPSHGGTGATTFPIELETRGNALLVAGPKGNGEALRDRDRDVLTVLATMLTAALAREHLLIALRERVDELEQHREALRRLSGRVMAAREEERKRIATDLHDGPLQLQHAILRELDGTASAETCRALTREAAAELRAACATLRPPVLDDLGLPRALVSLSRRMEPRTGCIIAVEVDGYAPEILPPEAELTLYRIAQEALVNCAKHAGASAIVVRLGREGQAVTLEVRDDGRGVRGVLQGPIILGEDGEHLGVLEMRERATAWGGTLTIDSLPDCGTLLRAVLPLPDSREVRP